MKKLYGLISLIILNHAFLFAQWTQVPSPTTRPLNDVHFPSSQIGFVVGAKGVVLKTINGGNNWSLIQVDSLFDYNTIHFINDSVGYIAGNDNTFGNGGKILKTTNGGANWNQIANDVSGISTFFNINDSVIIRASDTNLYKSNDAGVTWSQLNFNFGYGINVIRFTNDSTGYFFGSSINQPVYKTTNGGQTFFQVYAGWYTSQFESAYFINDSVGYSCAWYNAVLEKTTDGGTSWHSLDSAGAPNCFDVYFLNETIGYYIYNGGSTTAIYGTANGGNTWAAQFSQNSSWSGNLNKFYFMDSLNAIAVGGNGNIYKTSNGGAIGIEKYYSVNNIKLYPNPAVNELFVDVGANFELYTAIKICSSIGEEIISIKPENSIIKINTENFSPGIYFLQVQADGNQTETQKIIIGN